MKAFYNKVGNKNYFVNMDETAIFFDCKPKRTVNVRGPCTVGIRVGGSGSRLSLCVSITFDGTKRPLFVVSKAMPRGPVERALPSILPNGMYGCVQENGWVDQRVMQIWFEKIWQPYVRSHTGNSMLLLDDYVCHKQEQFVEKLSGVDTLLTLIPPGYTSVLQPCDVGINKPLKSRLQKLASDWRAAKLDVLGANEKMLSPGRKDVCC